jgi:hypothetical protein
MAAVPASDCHGSTPLPLRAKLFRHQTVDSQLLRFTALQEPYQYSVTGIRVVSSRSSRGTLLNMPPTYMMFMIPSETLPCHIGRETSPRNRNVARPRSIAARPCS